MNLLYNVVALECLKGIVAGSYGNPQSFIAEDNNITSEQVRARMAFDQADAFMEEMRRRSKPLTSDDVPQPPPQPKPA